MTDLILIKIVQILELGLSQEKKRIYVPERHIIYYQLDIKLMIHSLNLK